MNTKIISDTFKSLIKRELLETLTQKPNDKTHPNLVPLYIFIKLCKKYKMEHTIYFTEFDNHVMFQPFIKLPNDKKLGWLCFSTIGKHLTTLKYFTGFKPYQNQRENETPLDRPSIVITGGQTLCGEESDPGTGFPNIRVKLITTEHPFAFGSDLWELNSINRLISDILEINKEFEFG